MFRKSINLAYHFFFLTRSHPCFNYPRPVLPWPSAPGPPLLEDLQTDNRTIIVNWKDPVDKNGIIDGYNITWRGSSGVSHEDYEAAGVYTHQISDLEPCQNYSVAVTAHTGGGWGNYSDTKTAVIENYSKCLSITV